MSNELYHETVHHISIPLLGALSFLSSTFSVFSAVEGCSAVSVDFGV